MADFAPALSRPEAEARMIGLAGEAPGKTRGPKRALRALAHAVGLDAPVHITNDELIDLLADHLGVPISVRRVLPGGQVLLLTMNELLFGAFVYFQSHDLPRPSALPEQFRGLEWNWFVPARSKIEAVNRISGLTNSGPEELGPGGKERKSVLVNLAQRTGLPVDIASSKIELGEAIATSLGVIWTDTSGSTGYTVTLEGLNLILAAAERLYRERGQAIGMDPATEANKLLGALASEFAGGAWDGRASIEQMRTDGYRQWRQSEWPGWYFEYRGLTALHNAMGPQPVDGPTQSWGRTKFDYAFRFVWDLKAHSARGIYQPSGRVGPDSHGAPLNDMESTAMCVEQVGVGLLMLSGNAHYDEAGTFDAWHRQVTAPMGKARPASNSNRSRARKEAFEPLQVTAYRWDNVDALRAALAHGALTVMNQGRQAPRPGELKGAQRPPKYGLNIRRAEPWALSSVSLAGP